MQRFELTGLFKSDNAATLSKEANFIAAMDLFEEYSIADAAKVLQSAGVSTQAPIFSLKRFDWDRKGGKQAGRDPLGKTRVVQDVAVSNNVVIIATTNCCILRWNAMDAGREPERIEMPVVAAGSTKLPGALDPGDSIERVFIDPTANHVFIAMKSSDNYYLHSRSQKPKKLSRLQGVVESVAFDRQNCTESATRSFLVGTVNGVIYEMSVDSTGKEKLCQPVYQLDQPIAVSSLYFDTLGSFANAGNAAATTGGAVGLMSNVAGSTFTAAANVLSGGVVSGAGAGGAAGVGVGAGGAGGVNNSEARYFVLWCTASPTRLYHLTGGPTLLGMFSAYLQSGTSSYTELPSPVADPVAGYVPPTLRRSQLVCFSNRGGSVSNASRSTSTAQQFALMTEIGIYHGTLLFSTSAVGGSDGENVIVEAQHTLYVDPSPKHINVGMNPPQSLMPVSVGVTDHHYLVLRPGQLQMLSCLSGELVQEEAVKVMTDGVALALVRDPTRSAPWLVTTTALYQVSAVQEDRHVWKEYLSRAVAAGDDALFESALAFSKEPHERVEIMRARAAASIQQGRIHLAAIYYAQSGLSFDEVALSLLHCLPHQGGTSAGSGGPSGAPGGDTTALSSHPLSSLIESNLSYFGESLAPSAASSKGPQPPTTTSATSATTNTAGDYTRVAYQSPSIVDAAITTGCALSPLKVFLLQVLRSLGTGAKMQRTMICTWLCDLYLHQISLARLLNKNGASTAGNSTYAGAGAEYEAMVRSDDLLDETELTAQIKDFLRSNKSSLDIPTTLALINARNHGPLMLFFAQIVGDYHKVVSMTIAAGRINEAIAVLSNAPIERVMDLIYKTAPVLMAQEPEGTVHVLLSKPQLSVAGLLPALLSYCNALDAQYHREAQQAHSGHQPEYDLPPLDRDFEYNQVNFAVLFLKTTLSRQGFMFGAELPPAYASADEVTYTTPEAATFHTLVWMLARYEALEHEDTEQELVALLTAMQESRAHDPLLNTLDIDYEYILRQCRLYRRRRASVRALLLLECTNEAIAEAIALDVHDAKQLVHQLQLLGTPDDTLKQLWMEIAKVVIAKESDMAVPIALIQESGGILSIDDLLPHLPNFTEIELFQDEICRTLQTCGDNIQLLKDQMRELADTAETTMQELESMKTRAYSMTAQQQRCEYCADALLGRAFYLFPCSHGFHCQCLVQRCTQHLSPAQVSAVQGVEEQLRALASKGKDLSLDRRARAQQEALQMELDGYIAADCPLCGYVMIQSLSLSLITDTDAEEAKAWAI